MRNVEPVSAITAIYPTQAKQERSRPYTSQTTAFLILTLPWGQGYTKCCQVPSTSCDPFTWERKTDNEMHLKENTFFDLDLGIKIAFNIA